MNQNGELVNMALVGTGGMARHHTRAILQQQETTHIHVVCEPSGQSYEAFCELYDEAGLQPPPNEPDLDQMLNRYGSELDAAFIITPHVYHYAHATACLEAGVDVLLEKPMMINADEAERLIATRDRTKRLLVVSFNGSLSRSKFGVFGYFQSRLQGFWSHVFRFRLQKTTYFISENRPNLTQKLDIDRQICIYVNCLARILSQNLKFGSTESITTNSDSCEAPTFR